MEEDDISKHGESRFPVLGYEEELGHCDLQLQIKKRLRSET